MDKKAFIEGPLSAAAMAASDGHVVAVEYDEATEEAVISYAGGAWWRVRVGWCDKGRAAAEVFAALADNLWRD